MPRPFPRPDIPYPLILADGTVHEGTVFLNAVLDHPRIDAGDYTYASSHNPPRDWAQRLAPYLVPQSAERLILGRFCQIADGVLFVTASANHRFDGISSFPFAVFDGGFGEPRASLPGPGRDTTIGNDVWIGQGARILPGATVGNGVIIGAGAVVGGDVPDYAVVVGNPGRVIRRRFEAGDVARLNAIAWWDWPIDRILAHEAQICGGDIGALEAAAP